MSNIGSGADWKVPGEGDSEAIAGEARKKVCYFFDSDIGNFHYGPVHPMKPTRVRMCHSLVMNYGLYKKMEIFRAKPATKREMSQFHSDDYVDFLYRVNPENVNAYSKELMKYNIGDDSPIFDGLFEYSSISAGGSMEGAARLSREKCDIAVNWAGGLHHAKKAEASGFCYVNDIVLGILELLRYHQRVLYIDIDVHHGDGVEEAFYTTDRVMTISFHQYGEFFPGTGELRDIGVGKGKNYAVNVPLREGITDHSYKDLFQSVVGKTIEWYKPTAIVLQCGADSLSGDKIGRFNLSLQGHADCVSYVKSFNLPLLMLGGGGYTIRSVSRAWAYETGLAAGVKLGRRIPSNEYYEYYGPDYELDVKRSNMEDLNTPEFLHMVKSKIFDALRDKAHAPGVQMQDVPKMVHDDEDMENEALENQDPDVRVTARDRDRRIQNDLDLSDSEDEGMGGRRHRQNYGEDGMSDRQKGKMPETGEEDAAAINGMNGVSHSINGKRPRKSMATKSASPQITNQQSNSPSAQSTPRPSNNGEHENASQSRVPSISTAGEGEGIPPDSAPEMDLGPERSTAAPVDTKYTDVGHVEAGTGGAEEADRMDIVDNELEKQIITGEINEVPKPETSEQVLDSSTTDAPFAPASTPAQIPVARSSAIDEGESMDLDVSDDEAETTRPADTVSAQEPAKLTASSVQDTEVNASSI